MKAYNPDVLVDLRKFGYEVPRGLVYESAYLAMVNKIVFTDDGVLAVSLTPRNPHAGLSKRGKTFGSPYLFRTIFLDANSGKELRAETWSNASLGYGIFPGPPDQLVVWHDLDIQLRRSDGSITANLALDPRDFPRGASLEQSPSRRTLWADPVVAPANRLFKIATANLQPVGWFRSVPGFAHAVFDSWIAIIRSIPGAPTPLRDDWLGGPSELLAVHAQGDEGARYAPKRILVSSEPGCYAVTPLDSNLLALSGQCHELTVLDSSGGVIYSYHFKDALVGPVVGSGRAGLLAFRLYVLRGGSSLLDTFPRARTLAVVLLNLSKRRLVQVSVKDHPKGDIPIALSPDGCFLAMQSGWHLGIYRVCGSRIGSELDFPSQGPKRNKSAGKRLT